MQGQSAMIGKLSSIARALADCATQSRLWKVGVDGELGRAAVAVQLAIEAYEALPARWEPPSDRPQLSLVKPAKPPKAKKSKSKAKLGAA